MRKLPKHIIPATAAFVVILVFFCITYYTGMMHAYPYGIHTWAQADRLALAINFYDDGMNFFKPSTYNQYSIDGITGVEFPIQAYIAAIGGKIFGREHISFLFRLLDTVIGCTGLLFLFLACYKATKDIIFSIFPPLFVFCSPIFIYYTCNYLPDPAAVSVCFIAFYFILDYIDQPKSKSMLPAVALLTLATLIKTSVGIYLLGFIGYIALQRFTRKYHFTKKQNAAFILSAVISISVIAGYFFYNRYLNSTYNSTVFLAKMMPFKSLEQLSYFFNASYKLVWLDEYFILPQYVVLPAVLLAAFPILLRKREGKRRLILSAIFLCGMFCIAILMGSQLLNHDYYAVSIFLPFFTWTLLISTIAIRKALIFPQGLQSARLALGAIVLIQFFFADFHHHQRLQTGYKGINPGTPWAEPGVRLLEKLSIPKQEHILVLDEDDPNTHLLFFDRKGYNIIPGKWKSMQDVLPEMQRYNLRVLVCREDLGRALMNDPTIQSQYDVLAMQDGIALFQLK